MSRMPSDAEKPIVGLIYSESETSSNESRYIAYYLAGVLVNTGYAKAALIGYRADGLPSDLHRQREELLGGHLRVLPPGKTFRTIKDIVNVPVSTVQSVAAMAGSSADGNRSNGNGSPPLVAFCHWNELTNCDVLIVTINTPDSESCTAKMVHVLQLFSQPGSQSQGSGNRQQRPRAPVVFTLQRGVRTGGIVKDGLKAVVYGSSSTGTGPGPGAASGSGAVPVVEGLVGFAVARVLAHSAPAPPLFFFASTTPSPKIALERLSKEVADKANGPVNLLEAMGMEVIYRKTLTPFAWGTLLFDHLYALNALTGGDLRHTLSQRPYRLALALMLRESREALLVAAQGGVGGSRGGNSWRPEMSLVASGWWFSLALSPWLMEMLLAVPLPFSLLSALASSTAGGSSSSSSSSSSVPPGMNDATAATASSSSSSSAAALVLVGPMQADLRAGRQTMCDHYLADVVATGKRYDVPTPVCQAVVDTIRILEHSAPSSSSSSSSSASASLPSSSFGPLSYSARSDGAGVCVGAADDGPAVKGRMYLVNQAIASLVAAHGHQVTPLGPTIHIHPSVWEACYWSLALLAATMLALALAVLLYEYELE